MQITKKQNLEVFTPIEITFKIESQEELEALRDMATFTCTIPELLDETYQSITEDFLEKLGEVLLT